MKCYYIVLIVIISVVLVSSTCGPWVAIDPNTLPPALPDDKVDVLYLIAPLLECDYNDKFSYLDAYHGGLALRNSRTGNIITVNFDAYPTFVGAVLPKLVTLPNGTVNLEWGNFGRVFIYSGLNATYWDAKIETVSTISGTIFNSYINWVKAYNATNPWYDLWSVYYEWPGKNLIPNHECFTFVWESYTYMTAQGAHIMPLTEPISFLALFSGSLPPKVNASDPDEMYRVVKFYKQVMSDIDNDGYLGFMEIIMKMIFSDAFYIRKDNDYYRVDTWFPYAGTYFDSIPTPGH